MNVLVINNVEIEFPMDGETVFVPIKPICEVLGIDHSSQIQTIKTHPILGLTMGENPTVAGDDKKRKMLCLPLKYFFGWLFTIDARKVKPEAADTVIQYQERVYEAIYDKFFLEPVQQKKKLIQILEQEKQILILENQRRDITAEIKVAKQQLEDIKTADPTQLRLGL